MWTLARFKTPEHPEVVKAIWEDGSEAEVIYYPTQDEWYLFTRTRTTNMISATPLDFAPMFWKRMGT